jgi:cobaltochelatase CobN
LRHIPVAQRRIAIVLSAYPTKHSRIGNAVGLDTPVSVIKLLRAMRQAGYDLATPARSPEPVHWIRSRASILIPPLAMR